MVLTKDFLLQSGNADEKIPLEQKEWTEGAQKGGLQAVGKFLMVTGQQPACQSKGGERRHSGLALTWTMEPTLPGKQVYLFVVLVSLKFTLHRRGSQTLIAGESTTSLYFYGNSWIERAQYQMNPTLANANKSILGKYSLF